MNIELTIPEGAWRPVGDDAPEGRFLAQVRINGIPFSAEAVPIRESSFGQRARTREGGETVEALFALDAEGPFYTMMIRGLECLVVLYPSKQ